MKILKSPFFFAFFLFFTMALQSQEKETDINIDSLPITNKLKIKQFIIPAVLIGYGVIGLESDDLKLVNTNIKEEVNENIDKKITIDDFSQYLPAATVYGLNAMGIKGKHNFKDRSVILGTSYLLMTASVLSLKAITKEQRPDRSGYNSFPSGHTATAFAGAEFLWQEYKDVSIWYGISGYLVATGTGIFRIYNDRHWLTDVVAGAGFGILSTKVAYLISPWMQRNLFPNETKTISVVAPFYNGEAIGLGFVRTF